MVAWDDDQRSKGEGGLGVKDLATHEAPPSVGHCEQFIMGDMGARSGLSRHADGRVER